VILPIITSPVNVLLNNNHLFLIFAVVNM